MTMIEKVARAIAESGDCGGSNVPCTKDSDLCDCWRNARAAIEATAKWIEPQRNDVPACGSEFAEAMRAALKKGKDHD